MKIKFWKDEPFNEVSSVPQDVREFADALVHSLPVCDDCEQSVTIEFFGDRLYAHEMQCQGYVYRSRHVTVGRGTDGAGAASLLRDMEFKVHDYSAEVVA